MNNKNNLLLKDFLNSPELDMALENIEDGDPISSVLYHIENLCYDAFKKLPIINEERSLFRFTGFPLIDNKWDESCPIISDIINNEITLSSFKKYNDPIDPIIKEWIKARRKNAQYKDDKIIYQLIEEALYRIRICCLVDPLRNKTSRNVFLHRKSNRNIVLPTINDCNPLMWAHYANRHKGVCIQYRIKPSNIVDTDDSVLRLMDVYYDRSFPLDGSIPFTDSLVVKANSWSYENETRLIMYSRNKEPNFCHLKNFEVEAVYMGSRINKRQKDCLLKLLKNSHIKLFEMKFSDDDITKLESHEIL